MTHSCVLPITEFKKNGRTLEDGHHMRDALSLAPKMLEIAAIDFIEGNAKESSAWPHGVENVSTLQISIALPHDPSVQESWSVWISYEKQNDLISQLIWNRNALGNKSKGWSQIETILKKLKTLKQDIGIKNNLNLQITVDIRNVSAHKKIEMVKTRDTRF